MKVPRPLFPSNCRPVDVGLRRTVDTRQRWVALGYPEDERGIVAITGPRAVHPAGHTYNRRNAFAVDGAHHGQLLDEIELGHRVAVATDDPMWIAYRLAAACQPDHVRFISHVSRAA
jgi:hypothetical protein